METLTLRYFNVFGPRQDPSSPYSGVVSVFTTALLAGRRPVIFGDGLQSRDFTYVANAVEANLRALKARGLCGQWVNVATGQRTTLRTLLAVLARAIGRKPAAKLAKARLGDIRHSLADIGAARRLLGYRPIVALDEGLRRTVAWYREGKDQSSGGAQRDVLSRWASTPTKRTTRRTPLCRNGHTRPKAATLDQGFAEPFVWHPPCFGRAGVTPRSDEDEEEP